VTIEATLAALIAAIEANTAALKAGATATPAAAAPNAAPKPRKAKAEPVAVEAIDGPKPVDEILAGALEAVAPLPAAAPAPAPAPAAALAPVAVIPTPAPAAEPATVVDMLDAAAPATYDDAKTVMLRLSQEKGRQAVVDVLARFGVAGLSAAKPEQFGGIVELANRVLSGEAV